MISPSVSRIRPISARPTADGSKPLQLRGIPARDVPVVIVSFNRLGCLKRLVDWLIGAGQRRIVVVDNASGFPPLLTYLADLERGRRVQVVRLAENYGHLVLWTQGLLPALGIDGEYVVTDPDVVPGRDCPRDLVAHLQRILHRAPSVHRAGIGLRLDGVPDHFALKAKALAWEHRFWMRPAAPGLFLADIDTTFALYRPGGVHRLGDPTLRTGWPYLAIHEGFCGDTASPSAEDRFYVAAARRESSSWAFADLAPGIAEVMSDDPRPPTLVHLARRGAAWHGYLRGWLPKLEASDGTIDGIHADAGFHTLRTDLAAWAELRRVLRPSGLLVLRAAAAELPALRGERAGARWRRGAVAVPAGWRVTRQIHLGAEVVLHLRPTLGINDPFTGVVPEMLPGHLDLVTDFSV